MIETLLELDHSIFHFINSTLANPVFDSFLPVWTNFHKLQIFIWVIAPLILAFVYWKARMRGLFVFIGALVLSFGVDKIVGVIKPIFNRPRPFNTEGLPFEVIFRGAPQGGLSFPSGHAADGFFIAVFLGLYFPKLRWVFIALSTMTAYSRIYCGVHYPSDVIAGALLGTALAFLAFYIIERIRQIRSTTAMKSLAFFAIILCSLSSYSFEDPTKGKPFIPWLWEDQFKPTIYNGINDSTGLTILGVGALTTVAAHQYDYDVLNYNKEEHDVLMDRSTASDLAKVGSGVLGIGIAFTQIVFDQDNGLMHARAIALTSISHVTIAAIAQRHRPDGRGDYLPFPSSFPSGHTSSAFATAGALSYAYGWKAGIPAYTIASAIALSRISESAHWLSDITSGIALGSFWARASYLTRAEPNTAINWMPVPTYDGLGIYYQHRF